jgi:alpha-1,2-mannosyltransferase
VLGRASERTRSRLRLLLLVGVLVVVAGYLRSAGSHDQVDFGVYRAGGRAVLNGRDLYALRVPPIGLPFTYPPASAVLFAPLAWLPVRAGQVMWAAASLLGLYVFLRLTLLRYATGRAATSALLLPAVFILVARADPLRVNLLLGQVNVLIALLVVVDLCGVLSRVPRGVMTGIAAALKLTPLFLVAYFVAVRRYRDAAVAAATFVAVTALAFVVAPKASTEYWFHGYFADAKRTGGIGYISNQSINGLIVRIAGRIDNTRAYWLPIAIVVTAAILWWVRRAHDQRPWLAESIALAAILLLSPVSWIHHWILALPFLVACGRLAWEQHPARWVLVPAGALAIVLWFGVIWHVPNTHDREYHQNLWQFLAGNSPVLLLGLALASVFAATRVFSRAVRSSSMR